MRQYNEKIIQAFLNNVKVVDICKETGLGKSTINKYKKDPVFQKILADRRAEVTTEAVRKMQEYLTEGVETLIEIIRDPETAPQVKVNGLQLMFNQCRDWTTTTDIQSRIDALEASEMVENGRFEGDNENI